MLAVLGNQTKSRVDDLGTKYIQIYYNQCNLYLESSTHTGPYSCYYKVQQKNVGCFTEFTAFTLQLNLIKHIVFVESHKRVVFVGE